MVVIDIDMPKSCDECKIAQCSHYGKEWFYLKDGDEKNYQTMRSDIGCLIKCDIEDIKQEMESLKYKVKATKISSFICGVEGCLDVIDIHTKGDKEC